MEFTHFERMNICVFAAAPEMSVAAALFAGFGIGVVVVERGEDAELSALKVEIIWGSVAEAEPLPQKIAAHGALNSQFEYAAAVA